MLDFESALSSRVNSKLLEKGPIGCKGKEVMPRQYAWARVLAMANVVAEAAHRANVATDTSVNLYDHTVPAWRVAQENCYSSYKVERTSKLRVVKEIGLETRATGIIMTRSGLLYAFREPLGIAATEYTVGADFVILDDSSHTNFEEYPEAADTIEECLIGFAKQHEIKIA